MLSSFKKNKTLRSLLSAVALFTPDKKIEEAGALYLKSFSYDYLLVPLVFCLNGFFFGCGRTVFAAANSIVAAFAIRIPVAFVLCTVIPGAYLFELGISPPVASVLTIIVGYSYLFYLIKSKKLVAVKSK